MVEEEIDGACCEILGKLAWSCSLCRLRKVVETYKQQKKGQHYKYLEIIERLWSTECCPVERLHVLWDFERREICFHVVSARAKLLDNRSLNARTTSSKFY